MNEQDEISDDEYKLQRLVDSNRTLQEQVNHNRQQLVIGEVVIKDNLSLIVAHNEEIDKLQKDGVKLIKPVETGE